MENFGYVFSSFFKYIVSHICLGMFSLTHNSLGIFLISYCHHCNL